MDGPASGTTAEAALPGMNDPEDENAPAWGAATSGVASEGGTDGPASVASEPASGALTCYRVQG
jgi:hypothetical protein